MNFKKYHGLGNDYLVYDPNVNELELNEERIKLLCHRNFGIGSDGILYGPFFYDNNILVKIFNPDGTEAEKSGNGIRIFAKYLKEKKYINKDKFDLYTISGKVEIEFINDNLIKVFMGKPTYKSNEIPVVGNVRQVIDENMTFNGQNYKVSCLSIGNPHCVILMDDINKEKAIELGKYVENDINFPNKINMQLLKIIDRNNIQIEIYERGAGYTLASGSSSCAAASVAYKLGLVNKNIIVHMPGGNLKIEISDDESIYMIGNVENIADITLLDNLFLKLQHL